jgi:signal transduction histidine kinase
MIWHSLSAHILAVADLNSDGREEILFSTAQGEVIALNDQLDVVRLFKAYGQAKHLELQDFDRDFQPDIYVTYDQGTSYVLRVLNRQFEVIAAFESLQFERGEGLDVLETPVTVIVKNQPGAYTFYDIQRTPLVTRLTAVTPSYALFAAIFLLGAAATYIAGRSRFSGNRPGVQRAGGDIVQPDLLLWAEAAQALAHELKSPLNIASLAIRRLMPHLPHYASDFRVVLDELERLRRRANALMGFLQHGSLQPREEQINDLIGERVAFFRSLVPGTVEILWQPEEALPMVSIDRSAMNMAIENLLENAVEAVGAEGQILIATRKKDKIASSGEVTSWVEVEIMDTGKGIPSEHRAKIFEPTFTTKPAGTGYGLSIARHVVNQHGGGLEIQSPDSGGTIALVTLPASPCREGELE